MSKRDSRPSRRHPPRSFSATHRLKRVRVVPAVQAVHPAALPPPEDLPRDARRLLDEVGAADGLARSHGAVRPQAGALHALEQRAQRLVRVLLPTAHKLPPRHALERWQRLGELARRMDAAAARRQRAVQEQRAERAPWQWRAYTAGGQLPPLGAFGTPSHSCCVAATHLTASPSRHSAQGRKQRPRQRSWQAEASGLVAARHCSVALRKQVFPRLARPRRVPAEAGRVTAQESRESGQEAARQRRQTKRGRERL